MWKYNFILFLGGYNFIGQFGKVSVGNDICIKLKERRD